MALLERTQRPGRVLTLLITAYLVLGTSSSLPWPVSSLVDETLTHLSSPTGWFQTGHQNLAVTGPRKTVVVQREDESKGDVA